MPGNSEVSCRLCGQAHAPICLGPGEKALCLRCNSVLAKGSRMGPDAALAFSVAGLAFALPSVLLPFISAGSLGNNRISLLLTGVWSLWVGGMPSLAMLVFLCGWVLPVLLLAAIAVHQGARRMGWERIDALRLPAIARVLGHGAIPEVQVLAVLVGIVKLESTIDLTVGAGFWCYCMMALSLLLAQHSFEFNPTAAGIPANAANAAVRP